MMRLVTNSSMVALLTLLTLSLWAQSAFGADGIASMYPRDQGIENDPSFSYVFDQRNAMLAYVGAIGIDKSKALIFPSSPPAGDFSTWPTGRRSLIRLPHNPVHGVNDNGRAFVMPTLKVRLEKSDD